MLSADLAVIFPKYKPQNERNRIVEIKSQLPHSASIILVLPKYICCHSSYGISMFANKDIKLLVTNTIRVVFSMKKRLFIVVQLRYI